MPQKPRKLPPEGLSPYDHVVARAIAHKVCEWVHSKDYYLSLGEKKCKVCQHPEREELEYLILVKAPLVRLLEVMGGNWRYQKFNNHRIGHLDPIIVKMSKPPLAELSQIPFPTGGTDREQNGWFLEQSYGIYLDALQKGAPDRAVRALHSMSEFAGKIRAPKPVEQIPEIPAPAREVIEIKPRTNTEKLQMAIERSSTYRKANAESNDEG